MKLELIPPLFFASMTLSSSPVPPVMSKGIGALPQRARRGVCLDTDTARTVTLALSFDSIFSSLINSVQKQENLASGRLKSSQELDKTDEISTTLWYSVLQVVLYPLLGLIMRGICYGSFLQEVVQIID